MMHWEWCYIGEHELPEKELISWGYQCFGHSIVAFTFYRDAWTLASLTSNPRYSTLAFRNSHLWILPYILASLSLFSVVSSDLSVAPKNYRKLISIFDCLMDQCTIIKTYSLAPILFVRKKWCTYGLFLGRMNPWARKSGIPSATHLAHQNATRKPSNMRVYCQEASLLNVNPKCRCWRCFCSFSGL